MRFQLTGRGSGISGRARVRRRRAVQRSAVLGPWARAGRPRRPKAATPAPKDEAPKCRVRILDNPWNTYDEVMRICVVALGCSMQAAYEIAWTVDHEGSAIVLEADEPTASHVAGVIETIGIEVRVERLEPAR